MKKSSADLLLSGIGGLVFLLAAMSVIGTVFLKDSLSSHQLVQLLLAVTVIGAGVGAAIYFFFKRG